MNLIKSILLLVTFGIYGLAFGQYSISNIPNPKDNGQDYFVSNPDHVLSSYVADSLNRLLVDLEGKTSAEFAVVVVNDFDGEDDFEFALALFNTWGIGKTENDNGLLLLIAKDRRVYRFITGYGMEGLMPDGLLKNIGETCLVPYFKAGDYNEGMMATVSVIHEALTTPGGIEELKAKFKQQTFLNRNQELLMYSALIVLFTFLTMKWTNYVVDQKIFNGKRKGHLGYDGLSVAGGFGCLVLILFAGVFIMGFLGKDPALLFQMKSIPWYLVIVGNLVILFKYQRANRRVRNGFRDEKNRMDALRKFHGLMIIPMLLSPMTLFALARFANRNRLLKQRFVAPDSSGNWERLDRDELRKKTDLLDKGQLKEEQELSRSYQLWKNVETGKINVMGWPGIKSIEFSVCPSCGFRTQEKESIKTIKAATYSASGLGEKIKKCKFCNHKVSLGKIVLSKKVRSSSSSSSGGSSRSSSSSSSGSFGGGRSGGGGAGGSW